MRSIHLITPLVVLGGSVNAAKTPTTVDDVADPIPEALPHHFDQSIHPTAPPSVSNDLKDFDINSARVLSGSSSNSFDDSATEYTLGPFRLKPNDYKLEGFFIVFFLFYLITTVLIRRKNRKTISNWYKSQESTLRKEFAGVGFGVEDLWKFENRGLNEAVSYVSGRRGIDYGWIKIELNGFDLVSWSYYKLRGLLDPTYRGGINKIVLDFKLASPVGTPNATEMCFAILRREELKHLRDSRWDLKNLTKLSENLPISPNLIVMTESGDITSSLLLDPITDLKDSLQKEFANGGEGSGFESLVISDLPSQEPDVSKNLTSLSSPNESIHLILTLRLVPESSKPETANPTNFISLCCNIADVIHQKPKLLPEVAILKAKKRRSELFDQLMKPNREKLAMEETFRKQDELARKRRQEQEKKEERDKVMKGGTNSRKEKRRK